jgi:hypothetical protein
MSFVKNTSCFSQIQTNLQNGHMTARGLYDAHGTKHELIFIKLNDVVHKCYFANIEPLLNNLLNIYSYTPINSILAPDVPRTLTTRLNEDA